MIDPATFKIRFPEFDSVLDARIQLFIDDAELILNEVYWGEKFDLGTSYYVAHELTRGTKTEAGSSLSSGLVASKAVDGVSISYTNKTPTADDEGYYASTSYGQKYLALRKNLGVPAFVI